MHDPLGGDGGRGDQQYPLSNSPQRRNLVKINQLSNNTGLQQGNNFSGINIRRQAPAANNATPKRDKVSQLNNNAGATALGTGELIEHLGVKTRTGFIPQMRKVNQDSYCIQRELGSVPGLWMFGVMDGHGVNGHQASNFCKTVIPAILGNLIGGASP